MGEGAGEGRTAKAERRKHAQEEDDVGWCSQEDRRSATGTLGEGEGVEEVGIRDDC